MSKTDETRHIKWHESCNCKFRSDASVWNNKQLWNNEKCRCESKELIDKGRCDTGFIWNPSICECECDELCVVREYLDYKICKCRKIVIDNLVEEWSENINKNEIVSNKTVSDHEKWYGSCTICIVLFVIILISIIIIKVFIYFRRCLNRSGTKSCFRNKILMD